MSRIDQVVIYVQTVQNRKRVVDIVAKSDNVRNADITEISNWLAGNDSQTYIQFDRENIFFHPLPYGDFALGIINHPDNNFSTSSTSTVSSLNLSQKFFVRVLIISPSVFFQFANNPIAIYDKLNRDQKLNFIAKPPAKLNPLETPPDKTICNTEILKRIVNEIGAVTISRLFQSLLDSVCTIFCPHNLMPPTLILNGIFNLLPVRFRTELTFSTAAFLSSDNPFQAVGFSGDSKSAIKLANDSGASLIDFEKFRHYRKIPQNIHLDQWSQLIFSVLSNRDFAFWEYQIKSDAESNYDETVEFIDWRELNDLAIIWRRDYPKKPIIHNTNSAKTVESAEKELKQSIAAVEKLLADSKRKPAG
ncbi:MAG: hypothetical protein LBB88_08855 [Planctomycetaceae bacterium]|jgi:hypothetical protein|nr:hypothetical protein [Planctomycetaceae bacterium]